MTRIHFVYPHAESISCPDAIGRNVAERLRMKYEVIQYDWMEGRSINPEPGDVLLGHAHPAPWSVFRRSAGHPGWKRIIMLQPYHHGDLLQMAWADAVVAHCDLFLAITGNYWAASVGSSDFAHWLPKMVHVDLAIDRKDFPIIKTSFNARRSRRFLYVGHSGWQKNLRYLSQIAQLVEEDISWIGPGKVRLPRLQRLGVHDFRNSRARGLVAEHDFLIIASLADANPAVVLEAMAWGLIPVCTPGTGYSGYDSIVNIPSGDAPAAAAVLAALQETDADVLSEMQARNWALLEEHFNWRRFVNQVASAVESEQSFEMEPKSLRRWLRLRAAEVRSPYFFLRPRQIWSWLSSGID